MKWSSNPLLLAIAFLTACNCPDVLMKAANPPAQKAAGSDMASTNKPLIIIKNPDGTLSVQKEGRQVEANNAKGKTGLLFLLRLSFP
jgi:hypothetical protein